MKTKHGPAKAFLSAITKQMQKLGINQMELSRRMDVHPSFITRLLNENVNMSIQTMSNIAEAVGCKVEIRLKEQSERATNVG